MCCFPLETNGLPVMLTVKLWSEGTLVAAALLIHTNKPSFCINTYK